MTWYDRVDECPKCGGEVYDWCGEHQTCNECGWASTAQAALMQAEHDTNENIDPALMGFAKLADQEGGQ